MIYPSHYGKGSIEENKIPISKLRPFLQWFSYTGCSNYTLYNRDKFQNLVKWVYDYKN